MSSLPRKHPKLALFWKVTSITAGSLLILLGLVLLLTPGPGWLLIFGGLALLSPHSRWARSVLTWLKVKLRIGRKEPPGEAATLPATGGEAREDRRARM